MYTSSHSSSSCGSCGKTSDGAFGWWCAVIVVIALAVWFALALFNAIDNAIVKNAADADDPQRRVTNAWWHALIVFIIVVIIIWLIACYVGCGGCGSGSGMKMGVMGY